MKKTLLLIINILLSQLVSANTYLSDRELKKGLNCTKLVKLTNGAFYCETFVKNSDGEIDKFKLIIADRNRPYRLRPIIQVDAEATKLEKSGRFKNKSVLNHIESRASSKIIGAINGDSFGTNSKIPIYKYSIPSFPLKTFIYGGININQSENPEAILSFSSETNHIGIKTTFNNIGIVREGDNFISTFYNGFYAIDTAYNGTTTFIEQGGKFNNSKISKSNKKDSYANWSIGLTQGSILGGIYAPPNDANHLYVDTSDPKNIHNDNTKYGINYDNTVDDKKSYPRFWYENTCYYPNNAPEEGGDYIPFISFNEKKIILGVSDTEIKKNKHVCHFLRDLNMNYGTYLDGGGSTQLVVRNPLNYKYIDKSPNDNNRKVLSAIALVENYPDIDNLDEEYKRAIYYLTDFGVLSGDENGDFGEGKPITRAEISKMIVRLLEIMQVPKEKTEYCEMTRKMYAVSNQEDISHWFFTQTDALQAKDRESYAKEIVCKGILNGRNNTRYLDINGNVTYWELSKMISIAFQGRKQFKNPENNDWPTKYSDCLQNYGKGYTNRFKEKYKNIFDDKLQGVEDENTKKWFSPYALREDVALFLYRAFILWQDKKFDNVSESCVEK